MNYDPYRDGVTQGLLATFMRCRQEAKHFTDGYEVVKTSQALQFGTVGHHVLEMAYAEKAPPSESGILKMLAHAEKEYLVERGGRATAEEMEMLENSLTLLEAVLPGYFRFYAKDFSKMNWAELEQKFRVPSPIPKLDLVGRIDGAYWTKSKELWQFESKTKSRIEEDDLTQKLTFDFQNNIYQWVLNKKYKTRPAGVLYNVIRRPGHKRKDGESLVEFKGRVAKEVAKDPRHFFMRFEVTVPATEMKRFEYELTSILKEFVAWWEGNLTTWRNTSACLQQYGACRYLPLCANNETALFNKKDGYLFPELKR